MCDGTAIGRQTVDTLSTANNDDTGDTWPWRLTFRAILALLENLPWFENYLPDPFSEIPFTATHIPTKLPQFLMSSL